MDIYEKKLLTFMIVWTCLLTLAGCGKKDMDYTMQNESSVAESVRETGEGVRIDSK